MGRNIDDLKTATLDDDFAVAMQNEPQTLILPYICYLHFPQRPCAIRVNLHSTDCQGT